MNIPGYSTNGLKMMYEAAAKALAADDAQPAGEDKIYGVREYADWKEQADAIEGELYKRKASYTKIVR